MVTIRVSTVVPAAPAAVWEDLRHIGRHVDWMSDAESIRILTEDTEGVGVRFDCVTRIGPVRLTDHMEVTDWREGEVMGIRHSGVVSGTGQFRLSACEGPEGAVYTRFEWTESLRFGWWMGGRVGAALARPALRAVWARNLRRFAVRF
ncbi:MAG: SRPBCC family protein [Acidimicrobiaceae bacterium]|nr:SRPBCC family protein [Acidimicrobiaceae bacterium]MCY3643418.1 SRPBCC family protein [Acidimicrobiaceae bacterium]MDE0665167.1 SRPBCC family protein [Acidimicrobiaceae bacterium]